MLSLYFQNSEVKKCDNFYTLYVTYFCYSFWNFRIYHLKGNSGSQWEVFARFFFHSTKIEWIGSGLFASCAKSLSGFWSGLVSICQKCCSVFWLLKYSSIKTVNHSFKTTHFKEIWFRSIWKLLRCYSETQFAAHFFAWVICQYSPCFSLSIQWINDECHTVCACRSSMSYSLWTHTHTQKRMRTCRLESR